MSQPALPQPLRSWLLMMDMMAQMTRTIKTIQMNSQSMVKNRFHNG